MDWDGVGTFALFMSGGMVGLGLVLLRAYSLGLRHNIEQARLEAGSSPNDFAELQEQVDVLTVQLKRVSERVDFNEKLLESGKSAGSVSGTDDPYRE